MKPETKDMKAKFAAMAGALAAFAHTHADGTPKFYRPPLTRLEKIHKSKPAQAERMRLAAEKRARKNEKRGRDWDRSEAGKADYGKSKD